MGMNGKCLFHGGNVTSETPACKEAKFWFENPPLFAPVLAGKRADGSPPSCADCSMFQPEGRPLGLVIFPPVRDESD